MKKVINIKVFFILVVGIIILKLNKPVNKPIKKVIKYNYVKVQDWKTEKNLKKIEYYEHLYNNIK